MISFREQVANDIENVFFNMEEFADIHDVEGEEIPVVLYEDDNEIHDGGSARNYDGLSSDNVSLAIKRENMKEKLPANGQNFHLDKKLYKVKTVKEQMGVVFIQLASYRGSGAR